MNSLFSSIARGARRLAADASAWVAAEAHHLGPLTVGALVVVAAVLCAYAGALVFGHTSDDLAELMEPYRLHPAPTPKRQMDNLAVNQPVLRRMADWLLNLSEAHGVRPALDQNIRRSGLPIGTGEFLLCAAAETLVVASLGLLLGHLAGLVLGIVVGVLLPASLLKLLSARRFRQFNGQLPDVLKLLAGSLRAGFSLLQSLDSIVDQVGDPIRHELRRALGESRLGVNLEDALGDIGDRISSRDFAWTVMAISIQREVGGNLAEILDTVATTMVGRERLRREVRTLTAEGRISAIILSLMPVAIGLFIFAVNRPYMSQLVDSFGGQIALIAAVFMELVGTWWMYRTIQIEV